ncbi:MAG TPA: GNAT family N-acetyltransferase [Chthoniobacterales bacterium]|jgi:hypothetical protein
MPAAASLTTNFRCLDATDPDWNVLIKKCRGWHPFYLSGLVKTEAAFHKASAKLLVSGSGEEIVVYPVLAFLLPGKHEPGYDLCGLPYAGPISSTEDPAVHSRLVTDFRNALHDLAPDYGWVTDFCRLNPFATTPVSDEDRSDSAEQVYVDLTGEYEQIQDGYKAGGRRNVKRANSAAGELKPLATESDYVSFASLYRIRMSELKAPPRYRFDEEYFRALFHCFRDNCLLLGAFMNGRLAGGSLNLRGNGYLFSYLLAVDYGYQHVRLSHGLNDLAVRIGNRQGDKVYVLGGGVCGADSVLEYKKSFSSKTFPQVCLKVVLDKKQYDRLCADGTPKDTNASFFPPWRQQCDTSSYEN